MKVISLGCDGPVKRDITHSQGGPVGSLLIPEIKRTQPEISAPLFVTPQEETTPRLSTPHVQQPVASKSRFCLPTGLLLTPNMQTSGLIPSKAENIEFKTRLASYSDDELNSLNSNSQKLTKKEHHHSKDGAWVDILVASHSQHAGNQDAELRRPGGPRSRNTGCPDPEVASQEVAKVMVGVHDPSPFDVKSVDIELINVPHCSKINGSGTPLDEIYAPTIPGSMDVSVQDEKPE
jgi:hypothetical protein